MKTLLALLAVGLLAQADIPYLSGRVVDSADILSSGARARIAAASKAHEEKTTNQVVVLTVPTIGAASIEDYAVKVFETWKLGQKGKDNGVLVVIAPQDRKMRIEVGYGLEATLTDGTAGSIIRTWMTPAFKAGNFDKGVEDGVAAIISHLEGHGEPTDRRPSVPITVNGRPSDFTELPWYGKLLIGLFVFGIIGLFTVVGIVTPGFGWFLYLFLIPFWSTFPMIFLGGRGTFFLVLCYLFGFPIAKLSLKRTSWYKQKALMIKSGRPTSIGGVTVGGMSSSSGWSSGGGSSFSGGGGSSGGGGASGSW